MAMNNDQAETFPNAAAALQASGEYRVLKRLAKRTTFAAAGDTPIKLGIVVDIEATGLNHARDEIIEFGMVKLAFSSDGRIFAVIDEFSGLREPSVPILGLRPKW